MTDYRRNGTKKPATPFSDDIRANGGKLLCLGSVSKDREGWVAEIVVRDGRAIGTLKSDGEVVRPSFSVKIDHMNVFKVDIGTGSGVCVVFQTGSNVL